MSKAVTALNPERGGATLKLLIIVMILVIVANAGLNYIPVAYNGQNFKQEMETTVVQAMAVPPNVKPVDMVKKRLTRAAAEDDVPADMFLEVKQTGNVVQARVAYTKQVSILPFGIYDYAYNFDHTATPAGYLAKDVK
jgi:hypothetical protein